MHAINPEIEALQKKSLEILVFFKEFCDKHNLLFYFCGGCCIGTLRHQGFIPWDDDIDVFMPRNDYEKLCRLWKREVPADQYILCRADENHFIRSPKYSKSPILYSCLGNVFHGLKDRLQLCFRVCLPLNG